MEIRFCPHCGKEPLAHNSKREDDYACPNCKCEFSIELLGYQIEPLPGSPRFADQTAQEASPHAAITAGVGRNGHAAGNGPPSPEPAIVDAGTRVMDEDESEIPCTVQGRGGRLVASMRIDQGFNLCLRLDDGNRQDFWAEVRTEVKWVLLTLAEQLNDMLKTREKGGAS